MNKITTYLLIIIFLIIAPISLGNLIKGRRTSEPLPTLARPDSDITNAGGWTTTPLWSDLNEVLGSGSTSVVSDGNPISAETFVVGLNPVEDPASSTNHVIRIEWAKNATGGADYDFEGELRQGYVSEASLGTLINASGTLKLTAKTDTTLVITSYTLSASEANSITNYADLSVRVWAVKNGGGAGRACQVADIDFNTVP